MRNQSAEFKLWINFISQKQYNVFMKLKHKLFIHLNTVRLRMFLHIVERDRIQDCIIMKKKINYESN
jgi:hypothetical protein